MLSVAVKSMATINTIAIWFTIICSTTRFLFWFTGLPIMKLHSFRLTIHGHGIPFFLYSFILKKFGFRLLVLWHLTKYLFHNLLKRKINVGSCFGRSLNEAHLIGFSKLQCSIFRNFSLLLAIDLTVYECLTLLPSIITIIFGLSAHSRISDSHFSIFANDLYLVTSYTNTAPTAPL